MMEFLTGVWKTIDTLAGAVYLLTWPLMVVYIIKLVRRLDIFVRIERAAKDAQEKPAEYRETMKRHERALAKEMRDESIGKELGS